MESLKLLGYAYILKNGNVVIYSTISEQKEEHDFESPPSEEQLFSSSDVTTRRVHS